MKQLLRRAGAMTSAVMLVLVPNVAVMADEVQLSDTSETTAIKIEQEV